MENDIHGYVQRYNAAIRRVEGSELSEKTKSLILSFAKDCRRKISYPATVRYVITVYQMSKWLGKDPTLIRIEDVDDLIDRIETGDIKRNDGEAYSFESLRNFKVSLKKFLKFLNKGDVADRIKTKKKRVQLNINDLWTEAEINKLLDAIPNVQDKTMAAVTIEGGLRIGETADMTISSVIKEGEDLQNGEIIIQVTGKTGPRTIMLVWSSSHLLKWLELHPYAEDKDRPLWIYHNGGPRKYHSFAKVFKKAKNLCGVNKPANPHNFRKSMTTILRRKGYDIELIKRRHGWTRNSSVMEHYEAIDDKALFNEERRINGLSMESAKPKPNSKSCPFCYAVNQAMASKCASCGEIIDIRERERILLAQQRELMIAEFQRMLKGLKNASDGKGTRILETFNKSG